MSSKNHTTPKLSKFSQESTGPQTLQPILTSPTSKTPTSLFRPDKKSNSNPISINLSFLTPPLESPTGNKSIWSSPQKSGRRERELEAQVATYKTENEKLHQIIKVLSVVPETDEQKIQTDFKLLNIRFTALEHDHIDLTCKNKQLMKERDSLVADNHLKDKEATSCRSKMNEALNRQLSLLGEISKLKTSLMSYESFGLRSSFTGSFVSESTSHQAEDHSVHKKELEDRDIKISKLESELSLLREQEARSRQLTEQATKTLEKNFQLQTENISLKDAIQKLMKENEIMVQNIAQLKSRTLNEEIVQKVSELIQENQRLGNVMMNSNREKEELKAKVAQLEIQKSQQTSTETTRLNQCVDNLVKENEELSKKLLQFSQTVDSLRVQISRLTEEKEEYRTRILQIYQQTTAFEELNVKYSKLAAENQRLIASTTQKQHELEVAQAKYKENQESAKKLEELKNQLIISNHDVERLSRNLKEKNDELDLIKRRNTEVNAIPVSKIWNKSAIFGDDFVRGEAVTMTKSFSGQEMLRDYRKIQVPYEEAERLRNYITPVSSDTKKSKGFVNEISREVKTENKKNLLDRWIMNVKDLSTEESFFDSSRKPSE